MIKSWQLAIATIFAVTMTVPARAEWREVETTHFRLYSEGDEKSIVRDAEHLEAVHYLMGAATGTKVDKPVSKVNVYYVASVDELHRLIHAKSNSEIAGIYLPSIWGSAAIVPRKNPEGSIDPQTVLFHEYAHHFMLQYQPVAYPSWYIEGWAELVSTASFERKGTITFGKAAEHRQYELDSLRWAPLRLLMSRDGEVRKKLDRDYGSFYGQSWLLAHYLTLSGKRPGQLRAYLIAILNGKGDEEAEQVFGDMDALDHEVQLYLAGRSFPYRAPPLPPAAAMTIQSSRVLGPGEAAVMDERIESLRTLKGADRAAMMARLEAKAARFPNDAAVQLLLAEQYAEGDDWSKSAAAAERAAAFDPKLARAQLATALALVHGDATGLAPARVALAKALELAPDDPAVLYGQYEFAQKSGEATSGPVIDQLIRASDLAPQSDVVRIAASKAMIERGDRAGAMRRLLPLASTPHAGSAQRSAQQLVDWLRGGGSGPLPAEAPADGVAGDGKSD